MFLFFFFTRGRVSIVRRHTQCPNPRELEGVLNPVPVWVWRHISWAGVGRVQPCVSTFSGWVLLSVVRSRRIGIAVLLFLFIGYLLVGLWFDWTDR